MVEQVPQSHLLLTTIAAASALQAEIPWNLTCERLPDVLRYIRWPNDKDELDDACRSLDYMLKRYNRQQLKIPDSVMSTVPFLIRYLTHSYRHVQRSSRGVLNTIASGSDDETQALLDANILSVLNKFLDDPRKAAQACTTILKLTAGTAQQIARIVETGVMAKVIALVKKLDLDIVTWREASWAVANALDGRRSLDQFLLFVKDGAVMPLCQMLARHCEGFASDSEGGALKSETTYRLLRCLDQCTIHLPTLRGQIPGDDFLIPKLLNLIEEVFAMKGYRDYRRESKSGVTRYLISKV